MDDITIPQEEVLQFLSGFMAYPFPENTKIMGVGVSPSGVTFKVELNEDK